MVGGIGRFAGEAIHASTMHEDMEPPAWVWVPSIATSGLFIYDGDKFPRWQGDLFAGGLAGSILARLTLDGDDVLEQSTLLRGISRIRDVRQGPDGYIYVAFETRRGTSAIVRLEPVDSD